MQLDNLLIKGAIMRINNISNFPAALQGAVTNRREINTNSFQNNKEISFGKREEDKRNWLQRLFGLKPKRKESPGGTLARPLRSNEKADKIRINMCFSLSYDPLGSGPGQVADIAAFESYEQFQNWDTTGAITTVEDAISKYVQECEGKTTTNKDKTLNQKLENIINTEKPWRTKTGYDDKSLVGDVFIDLLTLLIIYHREAQKGENTDSMLQNALQSNEIKIGTGTTTQERIESIEKHIEKLESKRPKNFN